jgi:hypothetical protein
MPCYARAYPVEHMPQPDALTAVIRATSSVLLKNFGDSASQPFYWFEAKRYISQRFKKKTPILWDAGSKPLAYPPANT